jgi:hypothetical protein
MSLKERLQEDLKEAMRRRDVPRRSALRLVQAKITNAEKEKQADLDEASILALVAKEVREHEDSLPEFKKANRLDLVSRQEAELAVLLEYLPEQLSREKIMEAAQKLIETVGAQGPRDKGKVMGPLMAELRGQADGRLVNEVVTELLNGA